jgi:xanthine dehydrogenase accessory factor
VLKQSLIEAGVPAEALARLRAPAGIDIAAIGPAEIALSILAEIVRERHGEGRAARAAPETLARESGIARH